MVSSGSAKGKLLRSSWHLFRLAFAQCGRNQVADWSISNVSVIFIQSLISLLSSSFQKIFSEIFVTNRHLITR